MTSEILTVIADRLVSLELYANEGLGNHSNEYTKGLAYNDRIALSCQEAVIKAEGLVGSRIPAKSSIESTTRGWTFVPSTSITVNW